MTTICTACGTAQGSAQRFCSECGARLGSAGANQTSPAPAPAPAATALPTRVSGERRAVSILFADLTNYTGLSTALDAEDLHAIVRSYTQRVTATVHSFGGIVERYIGDSVMAIFGAPVAHGDDALRAVRAALAIQNEVMASLSSECSRPLQASIGISFGEVMFTQNEPGHPEGIAVVGESVNLASRVQGQAGAGNIFITDSLRGACASAVQCELVGERALKGIAQPVKLYRVLALLTAALGERSRLLGRDDEVAALREAVARCATQARGSIVHLRGEPGIGKSRLLDELQLLGNALGLAAHASAYLDFGLEQTLSGVSAIVASLLGVAASDSADARQTALERAIGNGLMRADDRPFAVDVLRLPQRPLDRTLLDAMESGARLAAMRSFVVTLVTAAARRQPLVIATEDVHWMPASELAQLVALCELVRTEAVIVATTSRNVGNPLADYLTTFKPPELALALDIGPISATAARRIAWEFDTTHSPAIESCVARAEGNPLFLDQLLRHFFESGKSTVPDSIHNVVLARLDRLDEADRRAAQCAAVIGQRFGLRLLRQLLRSPAYDPAALVQAGIVKGHGAEWMFTHALVQEGVYASLLHSNGRALHREAADYYVGIDLILRAQHLDRAKDPQAAQAYLQAAVEQLAAFRFERSRELLGRGSELAVKVQDRVDLRLLEGRTLHDEGLIKESISCFRQALNEAVQPEQQCRAWLGLAMGMRMTDDLDGALDALRQAEPLAQGASLVTELGELHYLRGSLHFPRGELDECLQEHGQALALARQAGSPIDEARALSGLGDAHYARGQMKTAQGYFNHCMTLCREHGFGRIEAANGFMVATVRMYMNELDAALDDALESAALARRVGHQRAEIVSRLVAGWIYLLQSRPGLAQEQTQRGLEVAEALGAPRFRAFLLESVARIRLAQGDLVGAKASIDEALDIARSLNVMRFIGPWIIGTRALMLVDADQARAALAEGVALIDAGCVGHNYFWFYKHAMETCLKHGELAKVEAYAQRLAHYTASEPTPWGSLFIERARALAELKRDPGSRLARQQALQLLETIRQTGHHDAGLALTPFLAA